MRCLNPLPHASSGRISHAYIVDGVSCAETLAMAALCNGHGEKPCGVCPNCTKSSRSVHPDISHIDILTGGREIVVDQIRALKEDVIVVPNEADKKVYLLHNADAMNNAAQNALLAVLEEPPSHVLFILVTGNSAALLPTVRSRCILINSAPAADNAQDQLRELAAEFISTAETGGLPFIQFSFRLDKLQKDELALFIAAAQKIIAQGLGTNHRGFQTTQNTLSAAAKALARAEEFLTLNVGTGHISGFLCAALTDKK